LSEDSLKEIIKQEYKKCATDPVYFMKKYCYIQHRDRGRILFALFKFQEKVLKEFAAHRYNIILKSRQLGISTLTAAFALHLMLFNSDKNIIVIATTQDVAKNLVDIVRFMYDNLPSWLRIEATELNKLNIKLINGSQIKAKSSAGDSARSEASSLLIVDEAAFIEDIERIWGSAQQTLATGGRAIILSTPNGVGNWYHEMWVNAKAKKNGFNTIQLHWSMHPERDQVWRDRQTEQLGIRLAAQECDANFNSSGKTVVSLDVLDWYEKTYSIEPKEIRRNDLWIWQYPTPGRQYILCADVARGDAANNSAFHVLDLESLEQVAEYNGQIDTNAYGDLMVSVATEYNDAILVIENDGVGWAPIQKVIDRGYRNLFYTTADMKYVDPEHQFTNKLYSKEKKAVAGFTTGPRTRPLIITKLETYFSAKEPNERPIIRSVRLINELRTFVWGPNNKAQASSEKYQDDLCLALAIGLWVRDTALQLNLKNIELNKAILGAITTNKPIEMQNVGLASMHTPPGVMLASGNPLSAWNMILPTGEVEDLNQWLSPESRKKPE
jgi:hypothetical protein